MTMAGQRIFEELSEDIQMLIDANVTLHKHFTSPTDNGWAQWSDYRKWINFNIGSIQTVTELAGGDRYRDCYIILRSVLEAYLLIKLSMLARIQYFDLLPIKDPNTGKEKPGDLLLRAQGIAAKEPRFFSLKPMHEKNKPGRYWVRMLHTISPVGNTQEYVPVIYFFFKDYDPDGHYLSHLISKNSWAGSKWDVKKHREKQQSISKVYLKLEQILLSFQINKFATPRQTDAILAHYNFLSKFTHAAPVSYDEVNSRYDIGHLNEVQGVFKFERYNKMLCLLYALNLSLYFLELQLDYFTKEPDLLLERQHQAKLNALRKRIKQKYSFFWFIYNKPHEFDHFTNKLKRQKLAPKKTPNIPYYVNPLKRLRDMTGGWSNPILGQYVPPKIMTE